MTVRWEPVQRGLRRYWRGLGGQEGGRFPLPGGDSDVFLERVRMAGVDFSRLRFDSFWAYDSEFVRCDFTRAAFGRAGLAATTAEERWDGRTWPVTVYRECDFTRTRLPPRAFFGNAHFERCLFDGTFVRTTVTHEAQFIGCTFRGRVKARFWGRPGSHTDALGRDHNVFTDNDFTAADLTGVEFRDVDLRAQRLAEDP